MTDMIPFDELPNSDKIVDPNVIEVEAISEQTPQEKCKAEMKRIPFIYRMSHALYDHWATHVVTFIGFGILADYGLYKFALHQNAQDDKAKIEMIEKEAAKNNGFVKIYEEPKRLYNDTYVQQDSGKTITLAEAKESILHRPKSKDDQTLRILAWASVLVVGGIGGNLGRKSMNKLFELGDDAYYNRVGKIERKYGFDY